MIITRTTYTVQWDIATGEHRKYSESPCHMVVTQCRARRRYLIAGAYVAGPTLRSVFRGKPGGWQHARNWTRCSLQVDRFLSVAYRQLREQDLASDCAMQMASLSTADGDIVQPTESVEDLLVAFVTGKRWAYPEAEG